jgi:hypothetical protein
VLPGTFVLVLAYVWWRRRQVRQPG